MRFKKWLVPLLMAALLFGSLSQVAAVAPDLSPGTDGEAAEAAPDLLPAERLDSQSVGDTGPSLPHAGAGADIEAYDSGQWVIELEDAPGVVIHEQLQSAGMSIQSAAMTVQSHLQRLDAAQDTVMQSVASLGIETEEMYRVRNVLNAVVVKTDAGNVDAIRELPGVTRVTPLVLHERDNSYTVPFIGAAQAWENFGTLGAGIKVAVIDTGIDYVHTNFGGPGTAAAYAVAADPTRTNEFFPNAKVAGGWDFVGDAYTGSNTARPGPNPMDCSAARGGGHGTHVAGTVAGLGVNTDGTTYSGPYDTSAPIGSLRIGPGVAPHAELYAVRVFGCTGSTAMTVRALDWTVDPNGDGDYSDRMDVANLSLGSPFGHADDTSARAASNAALAGVTVVISAGNSNDVYYITSSPSTATRAISVAASVDAQDVLDGFRVDSPSSIAGLYGGSVGQNFNWGAMSSPVTAEVTYDPGNPAGCSTWPTGALTGKIVLIDWVPAGEETFPCGSAVRVQNASRGGAVGVIMADNQTVLSTAIAGDSSIPSILTNSVAGGAIKSELATGVIATLGNEWLGAAPLIAEDRNDTLTTFSSRGPRKGNSLKPDITAPGSTIFSAQSGSGSAGNSSSGTSMAAPHMSGVMALLRERNPDWTVEELKALAMNTAGHDLWSGLNQTGVRYNVGRVGAGRVDAAAAVATQVVAYSADEAGAVSVSFGAVEVLGTAEFTHTVKVVNHSDAAVTYSPSVDMTSTIPGVQYTFPDGPFTVPAGGSSTFRVKLIADASQMRATHDPTVSEFVDTNPRETLPEHAGLILLTPQNPGPSTGATLRVPVYVTARPASAIQAAEQSIDLTAEDTSGALTLTGSALDTGGTGREDYRALITPFELHHVSGVTQLPASAPPSAASALLQYAGVTTDSPAVVAGGGAIGNSRLYFGISSHADWSTPATEATFTVQIENRATPIGSATHRAYNTRWSTSSGGTTTYYDLMLSCGGTATGSASCGLLNGYGGNLQTAVYNNNVLVLGVPVGNVGLSNTVTKFRWRVVAASHAGGTIATTPWYTFDIANPSLDFTAGNAGQPTYLAEPDRQLTFGYNADRYAASGAKGILLLHNFNQAGNRAQVVGINTEPPALGFTTLPETPPVYGDAPFPVAVNNPDASIGSVTPAVCSVGPVAGGSTKVSMLNAGPCLLRAQLAGNSTTTPAAVDAAVDIAKRPLAVVVQDAARPVGQPNPPLTGTVDGLAEADTKLTFRYVTTATADSPPGEYAITTIADDPAGRLPNYDLTVTAGVLTITGAAGPALTITAPTDGLRTGKDVITVTGTATDPTGITSVTVNGRKATVGAGGAFSQKIVLAAGLNTVTVTATNTAGLQTTITRTVTAIWTAPVIENMEPATDVTLLAGQTYTFRFTGEAGLTAAYQVVLGGAHGTTTGVGVPRGTAMTEVAPGVYEAVYTAPANTTFTSAAIRFNVADDVGNLIMTTAPGRLTVRAAPR